jgi:hypothetical protein
VRVYLPSTMVIARAVLESQVVPAGTAFAVTPGVREWYVHSDVEEMEYAMLLAAARASLRLLDSQPAAPRRRLVFVAAVPDGEVVVLDDLERGAVRVTSDVPLSLVRAVHVDHHDATAAVTAAAAAVLDADLGDADAEFVVDEADGHDLLWFATQELSELLEENTD